MAKRPSPAPEEPKLTPAEMRAAISRFHRRIDDLNAFDPKTVQDRSDPRIRALTAAIDEALIEAFGHRTPAYIRYRAATVLDTAEVSYVSPTPIHRVVEGLERGKQQALVLLNQAIRSFEEKLADFGDKPAGEPIVAPAEQSLDVFVIHGQDDGAVRHRYH